MEGPSKRDPAVISGRTRQGKLVHFDRPAAGCRPGSFADVRDHRGGPAPPAGQLVAVDAPARATGLAIPVAARRGSAGGDAPATSPGRPARAAPRPAPLVLGGAHRLGQVRGGHGGGPDAPPAGGGARVVSVDSMAVYRGMDIGTAKPTADERADVPYHLVDLVDPAEEFAVQQFQQAARAAVPACRRGHRALLVGRHRPLPAGDRRRPAPAGALARGGRRPVETRRRTATASAGPLRPVGRARLRRRRPDRPRQPPPDHPGPRGHARRRSAVLVVRPGLEAYPPTPVGRGRDPLRSRGGRRADRRALRRVGGRRAARRGPPPGRPPAGLSRTARQAPRATASSWRISKRASRWPTRSSEAVRRTRAFARRQWAWFRRDPRIVLDGPGRRPGGGGAACSTRCARTGPGAGLGTATMSSAMPDDPAAPPDQAPRGAGTTSSSCWTPTTGVRSDRGRYAPCATAGSGWAPTGCIRVVRGGEPGRLVDGPAQRGRRAWRR